MRLRAWFNDAFDIRRWIGGASDVVVDKRNSLKFSTPCAHDGRLDMSFSESQRKMGRLETHFYCLFYPISNEGIATTRVRDVPVAEIERVNRRPVCYANPQVFEWLMGFPQNWTAIGE